MLIELMTAAFIIGNMNKTTGRLPMEKFLCMQTMDGGTEVISRSEIALMERVVMSEAGSESIECQEAIATTILNRWQSPRFQNSIREVVTAEGQYSMADNGEPTVSVRVAVHNAIIYQNTEEMCLPANCYYFRAGHYHNFGIPYMSIDHTYFSLAEDAAL